MYYATGTFILITLQVVQGITAVKSTTCDEETHLARAQMGATVAAVALDVRAPPVLVKAWV